MFTKKDLMTFIRDKMCGYEYGLDDDLSQEEKIRSISLETWCDCDLMQFVTKSNKKFASEIFDDYCRRTTQYMTQSTTDKGKDIFYAALMNATNMWEDLTLTYGDDI